MSFITAIPVAALYIFKGYKIIFPGFYQRKLKKIYGLNCETILGHWLKLIEGGEYTILCQGWRAKSSYGAQRELEIARKEGIGIINLLGVRVY